MSLALTFMIGMTVFSPGPINGITDVPGVRVAHVTKISGASVRTGATAILPNADPWNNKVSAATFDLNGNGEMTGVHWIREAGYLETPIVLTNTLNVGRVDDGVIGWMISRHPDIGGRDDVPLPVIAECDDQSFNDIRGRHVAPEDVVAMLDRAQSGQFERGSVGAGTGMRAFGFKAGIGSASRVLATSDGGYTVGVLVNANTGARDELMMHGLPIGKFFSNELLPVYPRDAYVPERGRAADGSIIVIIATDAPLDARHLEALGRRAALGLGRTGLTSHVSSGDLFLAFSTSRVYTRDPEHTIMAPKLQAVSDEARLDALYGATVEATEHAIYDSLLSARTMTGAGGVTYFGLPVDRVTALMQSMNAILPSLK